MNIFRQDRILKWNVSIMVILILLACSLMGILTVVFLKSLITYTDDTYSYHKSYYIAKAWLELALTEIDNSAMWFSHIINSGDFINENNFECVWCHFTSRIQWRSNLISNDFWENNVCDEETALVLQPWQSMAIPVFYDNSSDFDTVFSETYEIEKLAWSNLSSLHLDCPSVCDKKLNIWIVVQTWGLDGDLSWEYIYMTGAFMINNNFFGGLASIVTDTTWNAVWNNNEKLLPYIIISNPENVSLSFCIGGEGEWTTTKYFISSLWEYMWKTVWLQAVYAQPTPSFFINPYSSVSNWNGSSFSSQSESYR